LSTFLSIYTKYNSTNHNKSPDLMRMTDRISLQRYEFCENWQILCWKNYRYCWSRRVNR